MGSVPVGGRIRSQDSDGDVLVGPVGEEAHAAGEAPLRHGRVPCGERQRIRLFVELDEVRGMAPVLDAHLGGQHEVGSRHPRAAHVHLVDVLRQCGIGEGAEVALPVLLVGQPEPQQRIFDDPKAVAGEGLPLRIPPFRRLDVHHVLSRVRERDLIRRDVSHQVGDVIPNNLKILVMINA